MEDQTVHFAAAPAPDYYKPDYGVQIHTLDYGYNVNIGCQRFAFENVETLITQLSAYLRDPETCINNWNKSKQLPV